MIKRLLWAVGGMVLAACANATTPTSDVGSDPAKETFAASLGVNVAAMTKAALGTYYKDLTVGTGPTLVDSKASTNTVDYAGYLVNGTQFDGGTNLRFTPGTTVIGFVDGMVGMNAGGTRLVVVPSDLGYGKSVQHAPMATVPPNSTLVFRITLNSFIP